MIISPVSTIKAHATDEFGSINDGESTGHDYNGGGSIGWGETSGYRIYVVDQNFNCVTNVYDFINGFNTNGKHPIKYKSQATMGNSYDTKVTKEYDIYSLSDLQLLCGAKDKPTVPYDLNGGTFH